MYKRRRAQEDMSKKRKHKGEDAEDLTDLDSTDESVVLKMV